MKFRVAFIVLGVVGFVSGVLMVADGAAIGLINLIYVPIMAANGYFNQKRREAK